MRRVRQHSAALTLTLLFAVFGVALFGPEPASTLPASPVVSAAATGPGAPTQVSAAPQPRLRSVNIEDVAVGDMVLAKDPSTGQIPQRQVLQAFQRTSDHLRILTLQSDGGVAQQISTTDEHPFFLSGGIERKAGDLRIGDRV